MPKEEQQRKTADPLQDPLLEKRARGSQPHRPRAQPRSV